MRFADITGQEDLKRHLVQSVDAGRVSHAQLFTGQAGAVPSPLPWPMCNTFAATIAMTAIRAARCPDWQADRCVGAPRPALGFPG